VSDRGLAGLLGVLTAAMLVAGVAETVIDALPSPPPVAVAPSPSAAPTVRASEAPSFSPVASPTPSIIPVETSGTPEPELTDPPIVAVTETPTPVETSVEPPRTPRPRPTCEIRTGAQEPGRTCPPGRDPNRDKPGNGPRVSTMGVADPALLASFIIGCVVGAGALLFAFAKRLRL